MTDVVAEQLVLQQLTAGVVWLWTAVNRPMWILAEALDDRPKFNYDYNRP